MAVKRVLPNAVPGTAYQWDGKDKGAEAQDFLGLDATVAHISAGNELAAMGRTDVPRLAMYAGGSVDVIYPLHWIIKWGGDIIVMDEASFQESFTEE